MNKELRGTMFHLSLRSLQQHGLSESEVQAYIILYNRYSDNPAIWSQAAADKLAECADMHRYAVMHTPEATPLQGTPQDHLAEHGINESNGTSRANTTTRR